MTNRIDPYRHHVAGESLTLELTIENADGTARDLSGYSVSWALLPRSGASASAALLDDSDADVSVSIADAANGRVDVTLDRGATDGLGGDTYWQRVTIDDGGSGRQKWGGDFAIRDA